MFPLKDNIRSALFPWVNLALIGVNVVFFLYELSLGIGLEPFIVSNGFIPARFAAEKAAAALTVHSYATVISSMFLHGNLLHIVSNMWMLWIFGDNVEDRMGHGRYLAFYLLCGVVSVFAQYLSNAGSVAPMIGASGAISGVIGAYFLLYPKARILTIAPIFIFFYLVEIPAFFFIGFWFVFQFLQGAVHQLVVGKLVEGGVAWWAHVGGFAAGVALLPFFKRGRGRKKGQVWL
ncbi:MAG: rhomboid family intramembrane serine protease [Desulfobulbaceae bacterium]|nr:rhomboid family intramembrane serine protease [Desulfobulbaceae bacterium]HIJ78213.1 rhomboid family intramembrane serine protease [Deltaproteobacteria bacterium]